MVPPRTRPGEARPEWPKPRAPARAHRRHGLLEASPQIRRRGALVLALGLVVFPAGFRVLAPLGDTLLALPRVVVALPLLGLIAGAVELVTGVSLRVLCYERHRVPDATLALAYLTIPVAGLGTSLLYVVLRLL